MEGRNVVAMRCPAEGGKTRKTSNHWKVLQHWQPVVPLVLYCQEACAYGDTQLHVSLGTVDDIP